MPTVGDIDPFLVATQGITGEPITIATQGYILFIEEEIIEVPIGGGKADPNYIPHNPYAKEKTKKKKRITAVVLIGDKEYRESIELEDLTITAKDVKIDVYTDLSSPKITITVLRGNDVSKKSTGKI